MRAIDRGAAVRLALVTGVGGFVLALLSALVASSTADSTVAIAVRGGLVTVLLVLAGRVVLRGLPPAAVLPTAAVGLVAGHLLTLGWFNGQVYLARLLTDSVLLSAVLDLVLWLAVGLAASRLAPTSAPEPRGYA
jgi:hypothetical protein